MDKRFQLRSFGQSQTHPPDEMEDGTKLEDNFKEYSSAPIISQIMRRFAFGMREIKLLAALVGVVMLCVVLVIMFTVSKTQEQAAQAQARLFDNTCFTRGCLDTTSYALNMMNLTVDPCDNFYEYACGNYRNLRPLDADNRDHRPLQDLFLKNKARLRNLIESPSKRTSEWASERKLKHLFQSCMDDYTQEKLKGTPFINKVLGPLGGWYVLGTWDASTWNLNNALKLVQTEFWTDALWGPRVGWDWKDWKKRSIEIHPAGTGRYMSWFYYIDPKATKIQNDYKKFMRQAANLIVRDSKVNLTSQAQAEKVNQFVTDAFTVETHIARIASSTEWTDNPYADINKMTLDDLTNVTGNLIDWTQQMTYLFDDANVNGRTKVAIYNYNYLSHLANVINNITQSDRTRTLHNYLTWRVLEVYVSDLSVEYNHANREVYEDITGNRQFSGKWNYCFYYSSYVMNEAMGALFVADHFADNNRAKITDITSTTKQAIKTIFRTTSWLDEETRAYAESKLDAATFKLGYPDYIANQNKMDSIYEQLKINASDWFGNILSMNKFHKVEWNRELREQEDRSKWYLRTFSTGLWIFWYWNQVIVPAGILQFPFYNYDMPHFYTFGSIGSILGHFMLHIVDAEGSRWDKDGELMKNKNRWWTNATITAYADVRKCVINAYTNKTQGPVVAPNGKQINVPIVAAAVANEATAITSGVHISYTSYHLWLDQKGSEKSAPSGAGLTNDQLFFIAFGQIYCYNTDNELLYRRIKGGSLTGDTRVNLVVKQLPEFSRTFGCGPTSKMNPPNKCTLY